MTGGGAYKYAELIEKKLGLKIAKEPVGHISGTVLSAVVEIAFVKGLSQFLTIRAEVITKSLIKKILVYDST